MTTESLVVKLDGIVKDFESAMARARKESDRLNNSTRLTEGALGRFNLSSVAAGVSVGLLTNKIVNLSDAFTRSQNLLINVTDGAQDLANTTEALFDVSERSRASYESTATLYARLSRATKDLNLSQKETLDLTETLNKAFAVGGATSQEASNAIIQLSQSLGSGFLNGAEFNSVSEQAPVILDAIAFATGKARGELKKLGAEGKLTSKVLVRSVQAYQSKIEGDFSNTNETFANSLTLANNALLKTIGGMDSIQAVAGVAGRALVTLAENVDTLAAFAGSAAMAIALTNLKTLNATLLANPYLAAGAALSTLTVIVSDYISTTADRNLKDAIAQSVKSSVQLDIEKTTNKIQELSLEIEKNQKLLQGGGVTINTVDAQERIAALKEEIAGLVGDLANLQDKQAAIQKPKEEESAGGTINIDEDQEAKQTALDKYNESLQAQIVSLSAGARAAEIYAASQKAIAENNVSELQSTIDLINAKYDLIEANEESAEEQQEFSQLERDFEQFEKRLEEGKQYNLDQLEMLRVFSLTREELVVEQYIKELEMLAQFQKKSGATDEEMYAIRIQKMKDFQAKMIAIRKGDVKNELDSEKTKRMSMQDGARVAKALGVTLFEDNKALNSGLIIADTAATVMREYKERGPAAAAIAAAAGLAQLASLNSASIGGGGSVSAPNIVPDTESEQDNVTNLEVSSVIEGQETTVQQVRLSEDDYDNLSDAIARKLAGRG